MNPKMKKLLIGLASVLLAVALIVVAPVSRIVYGIYDANRTSQILAQLEADANNQNEAAVNDFHKQAYFMESTETDGGKTVEKVDLLVLTSDSGYELSYYERIEEGDASYTNVYFHMTGTYTREGNVLTVEPGIGALSVRNEGGSYVYYNAQYLTAEEAGSDKTRDEIYDMQYSSRQIALMSDGTFAVGGESDAKDELPAPEGRHVYTDYVAQGRKTYKTLVIIDGGVYFVYNHATNSNNAEQTTGAMFGYGSYEIKDTDRGIVPDETVPEQTYDIVTGEPGIGFVYANNNGSHMHFDLQNSAGFLSWLATNFNAPSPVFYVSETGFTLKLGALKTVIGPWGLYIPAADSGEGETTEPAAEGVELTIDSSTEGKPFVLTLNADGTLRTGWTNYEQTMLDGKWSIVDGQLVLEMDYTSTITENADGSLSITVNYGQMGDKVYTMTAEQFVALKSIEQPAKGVELEIASSTEGKPFILHLNADGTLRTGWTNYEQTLQDGRWSIVDGSLVLEMDYTSTIAENADGGLDITVNYGQMGDKVYTMTAEQFAALKSITVPAGEHEAPAADSLKLEIETSVPGKPFVLEFKADGTLTTGWTNYEQTIQEGKWSFADGALVLEMAYEYTIAENAEGGLDITVNYGQMGEKTYTMTADQAALLGAVAPAGNDVKLEIASSQEGKPFILYLNADGTLTTGWTNYEQTMLEGKWTVTDGALVLEMAYEYTIAENAEGGLDITVNYGQMGEKTYTLTADQAALLGAAAPAGADVKLEIASSQEGKPFILYLNADGTLTTGWTNYEQTMQEGKWTVTDGALALEMAYEYTIAENAEGGLDITVNYGQMGEKTYTMTADQAQALLG